jgi:hypothetical protein
MTDQAASARKAPRVFETDTHQSFVAYRGFFFLKVAIALSVLSIVIYAWHSPMTSPNGGTWVGYTLGTIGALLILWLTWFGYRKRSYRSAAWRLETWLSAHVYLGLSLIIVATLHTGFHFGWNIHTLAYALMLLVIASGAFGVYAYLRYPTLITSNRRGATLAQFMSRIAAADSEARQLAMTLTDDISAAVTLAVTETRLGGSVLRQLSGRDPSCATAAARHKIEASIDHLPDDMKPAGRELLILLSRKEELLARARRDIRYKAMMDIWLYFHVPLTFALLAALLGHVVSVFYYF